MKTEKELRKKFKQNVDIWIKPTQVQRISWFDFWFNTQNAAMDLLKFNLTEKSQEEK